MKPSEFVAKSRKKLSQAVSNEKHPNWKGGAKYRQTEGAKERFRIYQKKLRFFNKSLVLEHYGSKCACCGETEVKFLCVDHINNDGHEHRKSLGGTGGGSIIIRWIIKNNFPGGIQILCYNCNMSKGIYGCCPHTENEQYEAEHRHPAQMTCNKCQP